MKDDSTVVENIEQDEGAMSKIVVDSLKSAESALSGYSKKIEIDSVTYRRLNAMISFYDQDPDLSISQKRKNELMSDVVRKSINYMFENDFKKRLEEL